MRPGVIATFLFLAICGSKLAIIDRFGSDLPYWDQWPAEGRYNFLPWVEHHEFWKGLFTPTNEHRIVPTRLLSLGLFLAGGQWDARVQIVANAAIHAALVAGFFLWAWRHLRRSWALATAGFLILTIAPGIQWENVVAGFQSQFYFLIGFSFVAMGLLLSARVWSGRWWVGVGCALIAVVTMGSGALCALPVALVLAVRFFRGMHQKRDAFVTLAVCVSIFALGVAQRPAAPQCEPGHAHSVGQFLLYAARCLSWPLPGFPWLAGVFWLPWLVLVVRWLGTRSAVPDRATEFMVAAGIWVLLQTAAVSYARGSGLVIPANRYGEVSGMGVMLSFVSLGVLGASSRRGLAGVVGGGYAILTLVCVGIAAREIWRHEYPEKKAALVAAERSVQDFLLTGDEAELERQKATLPFPDWKWLRDFLARPVVPGWMPGSVRRPLPLADFALAPAPDPAPPLIHRRIHAVAGDQAWRSAPLPLGLGWWKIETSGHLGRPGASLAIVASGDGRVLGTIAPSKFAGDAWRAAYVRAPREPAVLVARADRAADWFAFSEPVEISSLSYWTWRVAKYGPWFALVGILGILGASVVALFRKNLPNVASGSGAATA